jgi:hypothetical protein
MVQRLWLLAALNLGMWLIYNLKLITTLWLLNLNNLKYIIFLTIYINIFLFEHWAPLRLPRQVKAAAAAFVWLLAILSVTGNNRQSPHFNLILAKTTKIQQFMHVCVMYTWLNFGYPCGGYARVWSLLFPVMDGTEDAIASLCYSEMCVSVLVTVWKLLQLLMERVASVCGVFCSER